MIDARIAVQKSGKSKGIAYVDMENEQAAAKAVQARDLVLLGKQLEYNLAKIKLDLKLEVFLSNPPKKSPMSSDMAPLTRKGHSSMLQLVPRAARGGNAKDLKTVNLI